MGHFGSAAQALEPTVGRLATYKAVILIFPDVPLDRAHHCIDLVQQKLKPLFVRKGLMLGEFHKRNNASGLRNAQFYPLRTPTPALAIRKIVPSDVVFLNLDKYDARLKVDFLTAFLKQFDGAKLNRGDTAAVADAEANLKEAQEALCAEAEA